MKVQEALKAALSAIDLYDYTGTRAESELYAKAESLCKAALSEIEKCEPVYLVNELDLGWEEVNRIYYDAVIDCPKRILYTSPISKDCESVLTNTNHGFVMTDRNFTYAGNGYIQDNNFDHDAAIKISGDFAEGDLDKYAQMIVKQLNTAEKG